MKQFKRIFLIVMDSVGCGHAKDAEKFNDFDHPNTLLDIDRHSDGLKLPNLEKLGLGYLDNYKYISAKNASNKSYVLRLNEKSNGKDTLTGHWEMMGLEVTKPFKTFFENIPKEVEEAATIDGVGSLKLFFKIIIPMALPVFGSCCFFTIVGMWNGYGAAMIFIKSSAESAMPLAYYLFIKYK